MPNLEEVSFVIGTLQFAFIPLLLPLRNRVCQVM